MTALEGCVSCRFFLPSTSEAFPECDGMCRRYAPVGPVIGDGRRQLFPPMLGTHWCGDYRPVSGPIIGIGRLAA